MGDKGKGSKRHGVLRAAKVHWPKEKRNTVVVFFPLLRFLSPLEQRSPFFTFARETPRSTPESVRQTVFFFPPLFPAQKSLSRTPVASLSPSIVYSLVLLSFLDQATLLLFCRVVDFQLKPEIRSNIRLNS